MASTTSALNVDKPSFAKVAAMAHGQKTAVSPNAQTKATDLQKDAGFVSLATNSFSSPKVVPTSTSPSSQGQALQEVTAVADGVEKLAITAEAPVQSCPSKPSTDTTVPISNGTEDERSHLSNSSTKPASFDTKSMASENTFAMDEKESLRPDDSASVQAADEDEPFFVPPSSARPDPQIAQFGSTLGARRPLSDGPVAVSHASRRLPVTMMANPPRFGGILPSVSPGFPHTETPVNCFPTNENAMDSFQQYSAGSIPPDEKLLEAMGTPKDRLLLLQLEEKFLAFIAQSKDATLDLPPQNSYERLLAHKLADYYGLARYSPTDSNSIRLYKAIEFRAPVSLSELVRGIVGNDSLPNGAAAVKIMRRTALSANKVLNDGSTAASSSIPSKATSETGAENTSDEGLSSPDATSSKDRSKWTREEKEAHYKAARERIFRDFQEAHPGENPTAETSANMSRSSSSSGRKKCHKQKTPRDDSFEARSSYVPGYVGAPYSSQNQYSVPCATSGYQPQYGAQTPNLMPTMSYGANATPAYSQYDQPTTFPAANYLTAYPNHYGSNDGWSNPQSPQPSVCYNFMQQPGPSYPPYGSGMSSPTNQYPQMSSPAFPSPNPQWLQAQYQQAYQAQPMMQAPMSAPMGQNSAPMSWQTYPQHPNMPSPGGQYQFGHASFQQYPPTQPVDSPHPFPSSYNRPAFNPQIRSFVPAGPNMPFGGPAGQGRAANSPFANQSATSSPAADYFDVGNRGTSAARKAQESLQKKWGTPAHLPKKPPPSQVPSTFEIEGTPPLPSQTSFSPLASTIAKGSSTPIGNS